MKPLLLLLVIFMMVSCNNASLTGSQKDYGERIDGPANIRLKPNGKLLFSLNDGVQVATTPTNGKWLRIGIDIELTTEEYERGYLDADRELVDMDGNVIGVTKAKTDIYGPGPTISGFTHVQNIKPASIPENIIAEEIKKGNISKKSLKHFIKGFHFEDNGEWKEFGLHEYFIYQSTLDDPSPRDRMTLLFNKEDQLVGIFHSRPIKLKGHKTYKLVRGHSFTVVSGLSAKEAKEIKNMRTKYYNSVD